MNGLPVDILIFAVVAALIFYRYMSILGANDDEDDSRRNRHSDHTAQVIIFPKHRDEASQSVLNPVLNENLEFIRKKDENFEIDEFVENSKTAFRLIVLAFIKKDMSPVKDFLSIDVMSKFKSAIRDRDDNIELKLEQILNAQILEASLNMSMAEIIVEFTSTQTIIQNGNVEGTEEVTDLWTFSKNIYSDNPIWVLVNIAPAVLKNKNLT